MPNRRVARTVTQKPPRRKRERTAASAPGEVLTAAEAAQFLRVSYDTLLAAGSEGPPWFTLGRVTDKKRVHRLYLRSAILDWARRRQAAA